MTEVTIYDFKMLTWTEVKVMVIGYGTVNIQAAKCNYCKYLILLRVPEQVLEPV